MTACPSVPLPHGSRRAMAARATPIRWSMYKRSRRFALSGVSAIIERSMASQVTARLIFDECSSELTACAFSSQAGWLHESLFAELAPATTGFEKASLRGTRSSKGRDGHLAGRFDFQ